VGNKLVTGDLAEIEEMLLEQQDKIDSLLVTAYFEKRDRRWE
jgi:hypothetical protein